MSKILAIVESPGKIKKLEKILGSKYKVVASVGHIIDLDPKKLSVDVNNKFEPTYVTMQGKNKIVKDLKDNALKSSQILLATDKDREGEMIAWSLARVLKLKDPDRIIFGSITKKEIEKSIKAKSKIDYNMVDAQKARRILDRIVGYMGSKVLFNHLGKGRVSAGRVQSVVTRLIIDKEDEIKEFLENGYKFHYKTIGIFNENIKSTLFDLTKKTKNEFKGTQTKMETSEECKEFIKKCMISKFIIEHIFTKESIRSPGSPFTTSTLQQEASRKLGFTTKRTMMAAQRLYEGGHITYMRTDSISLSEEAMTKIKNFILKNYGKNYYKRTIYKTKNANAQEAHEAIRPTNMETIEVKQTQKIGYDEIRLYSLIWKRTIASQMEPAKYNIMSIQISISKDDKHYFLSTVEKLVFDGFLKVYNIKGENEEEENEGEKEEKTKLNKNLEIGNELDADLIESSQEYKKPPTRYNEESLVNKLDLKNLGIGRPSTYASIINTILDRGYVEKIDVEGEELDSTIIQWKSPNKKILEKKKKIKVGYEKNKFVSTYLGRKVTSFLVKEFPKIMDYKFTAKMEKDLDKIEEGKLNWVKVLEDFYKDFNPIVERLIKEKPLVDANSRVLGKHPESGNQIVATYAKFGPVVKMNVTSTKCIYAPIKKPLEIESITLENAVKLFEFPKELGKYKNKNIILMKGKFGFYVKFGKETFPVLKSDITKDEIIQIIKDREPLAEFKSDQKKYLIMKGRETSFNKDIHDFIKVTNLNKTKKSRDYHVPLPDEIRLKDLTVEKIQKIVKQYYESKKKIDKK